MELEGLTFNSSLELRSFFFVPHSAQDKTKKRLALFPYRAQNHLYYSTSSSLKCIHTTRISTKTLLTCQPAKNQVTESISQYQSTLVNIRQHCPTLVKIIQLADCCLWSLILNLKKISVGALTKVGIKSTLMS